MTCVQMPEKTPKPKCPHKCACQQTSKQQNHRFHLATFPPCHVESLWLPQIGRASVSHRAWAVWSLANIEFSSFWALRYQKASKRRLQWILSDLILSTHPTGKASKAMGNLDKHLRRHTELPTPTPASQMPQHAPSLFSFLGFLSQWRHQQSPRKARIPNFVLFPSSHPSPPFSLPDSFQICSFPSSSCFRPSSSWGT